MLFNFRKFISGYLFNKYLKKSPIPIPKAMVAITAWYLFFNHLSCMVFLTSDSKCA